MPQGSMYCLQFVFRKVTLKMFQQSKMTTRIIVTNASLRGKYMTVKLKDMINKMTIGKSKAAALPGLSMLST